MKLVITYVADFGDHESEATLRQVIEEEGLIERDGHPSIILSESSMLDRLPITAMTVSRTIEYKP